MTAHDVFLCHNSRDKAPTRQLAHLLRGRSLRVWFDEWELRPGLPWQEELERVVPSVLSCAVLVGANGIGPWADREMRAFLEEAVRRRIPIIPVLLPGAPDEPDLPIFLKAYTSVDLRSGLSGPALCRLLWGITGKRPPDRELLEDGAATMSSLSSQADARLAALLHDVEAKRSLVHEHPRELRKLAQSLNDLARVLTACDRHAEALDATREALHHYRTLAADRTEFVPDLAWSCNSLARTLTTLDRHEEALRATNDAIGHYRTLAADRLEFVPDLAWSCNSLARTLTTLGRHEEALRATNDAIGHYRTLAADRPEFVPDLARSCNSLARTLTTLGRHDGALEATRAAVAQYRALDREFLKELRWTLEQLVHQLKRVGRADEAAAAEKELHALA